MTFRKLTPEEQRRLDRLLVGVEAVPDRLVQQRFAGVLVAKAGLPGFSANARSRHVRPRAAGGFDVLHLAPLKGGQFGLKWGLSLP